MRATERARAMRLRHSSLQPTRPEMRTRVGAADIDDDAVVCGKFKAFNFDHQHQHQYLLHDQQQTKKETQISRTQATRPLFVRDSISQREAHKTKPQKTYHPIIRLFGVLKLCIQLTAFLLIVPSKLSCLEQRQQQLQHQIGRQNVNTTTFQRDLGLPHYTSHENHNQIDQRPSEPNWSAGRLDPSTVKAAQDTSLSGQPNENQQLSTAYSPVSTRQTLLSSLVSHQSQRLLKNLVNSTIADLMSQSANRRATLNRLVQAQQQQQQQQLANQPAGHRQQQVDTLVNLRFPAVGKLYTLLFPTTTSVPTTLAPLLASSSPRPSEGAKIPNNSKHYQVSAGGKPDPFEALASSSSPDRHSSYQDNRILRLSAPYDTRPRQSVSKNIGPRREALKESTVARSRRDRSSTLMNNMYEPITDMEVGSESLHAAGIDPDAMAAYESSDLIQSNTSDEDLPIKRPAGPEVYSTGAAAESDLEDQNEAHMMPEPSVGGYGTRKRGQLQHERQQNLHQHQQVEESPDQQANSMGTETAEQQAVQQVDVPAEQPLEAEFGPSEQHRPLQQHEAMGRDELEPPTRPQPDDIGHLPSATNLSDSYRADNESYVGGAEAYKLSNNDTLTEAQNDEESFLTVKLPSQYDSVIRMPPEGYYDDYFKPDNNLASQSAGNSAASLLTQDNEPEFSLTPPHPPPHLPEHYDIEEAPANVSKWQRARTQSVQAPRLSAPANHVPTTVDYTKQFFMNQQPLKQGEATVDQNVEFVVPKANWTGDSQSFKRDQESVLNYEIPAGYESYQANNTTPGTDPVDLNQRNNSNSNLDSEDNIKLIIANTNGGLGNNSSDKEKIINYTSEGLNITWSADKAPRNTFVNKDMNEFPPNGEPAFGEQNPNDGRYSNAGQQPTPQQHQQQALRDEQSSRMFQRPRQLNLPQVSPFPQVRLRQTPDEMEPASRQQASEVDSEDELHRATLDRGYGARYESRRPQVGRPDQSNYRTDRPAPDGRQPARPRERRQREHQVDSSQNMNRSHQGLRANKSPTIRRPQLTQAHFDPKDLVMHAPTPLPSVTETALETITELPVKVRQLRDKQPDKNELMNELLTALDRVKVAIYKLQPLTAKMNAIYRKSITSNTRDIIMDNNKGTYAKRYPPGDYDDSYDRIHPSELLNNRRQQGGQMETGESAASAVYLPAPRELLESNGRNVLSAPVELLQGLQLSDSRIVATGIGRRIGDGSDFELKPDASNKSDETHSPSAQETGDSESPLFGYRITIFQSPSDEDATSPDSDPPPSDHLAYQLEGVAGAGPGASIEMAARGDDGDTMVTSESSVSESSTSPVTDGEEPEEEEEDSGEQEPEAEASESKGKMKKKKHSKEEKYSKMGGGEKSAHKESGKKKGEQSKKSQEKKKKHEVESKKKKEFKKIKHNKGIVSKEKKTMHRDKHIKAHDRGAAKEKALKERTQIEFFEREQIVDDEYEKAKKSTKKAGWQTGHDSKKTIKEGGASSSGEPMSMGGSHYVAHQAKDKHMDKSSGIALAASSGKKSNKYEKKDMEASGKKFKGWREKGYKIITETEFIDRGSLHDSAYKKRDKGAAQHHKFKKQQASSEGQHGSMQEHHKKSAKKEEKKEKSHEKKEKYQKKMEKEKEEKKKEKKEKSSKKMDKKKKSHDKTAAASDEQPSKSEPAEDESSDEALDQSGSMQSLKKQHQMRPVLLSASSSTFRPVSMHPGTSGSQHLAGLNRLLNANHHQEEPSVVPANMSFLERNNTFNQEMSSGRFLVLADSSADDSLRRSDGPATQAVAAKTSTVGEKTNATILDIVDNLTGRQVNKTKIGTYELDGDQLQGALRLLANSSLPSQLKKISEGRRLSQQIQQTPQQSAASSTRSTQRGPRDKLDPHLANLLQQVKLQQQQQQVHEKSHQVSGVAERNFRQVQLPPARIAPPTQPLGYVSADQARMAAQFLQLVQRTTAQTGAHQQQASQAAVHQQPTQRSIGFAPQLGHFVAAGPNPFSSEQFLDYESGPIHLAA